MCSFYFTAQAWRTWRWYVWSGSDIFRPRGVPDRCYGPERCGEVYSTRWNTGTAIRKRVILRYTLVSAVFHLITYWQNNWIIRRQMLRQMRKACYVKGCLCALSAIHKQFSLVVSPKDVVHYDITLLFALCRDYILDGLTNRLSILQFIFALGY